MSKIKIIIILLITGLFAGAFWLIKPHAVKYFDFLARATKNTDNISKLTPGMKKQDVLLFMGAPEKIEVYSWGQDIVEFVFYRTRRPDIYLKDKEENFTPLAFEAKGGVLINWSRKFYDEVLKSNKINE